MSKKITNKTMPFLSVMRQEITIPKVTFFLSVVLLTSNLSAIVDAVLHPEISYFDKEHLIIGGVYALFITIMLMTLAIYLTKIKIARQFLSESESKYRDMAELLPQFVFETDDKGNILFLNRFALENLEYTQDDLQKGLHAFQMFIPEELDRVRKNIQSVLRGDVLNRLESIAIKKDGTAFPVFLSASPIVHENNITGTRGIVIDITELKRAAEEIRKLNEELETKVINRTKALEEAMIRAEAASSAKSEFLANMSHEFITPLNAVVGFSQVLKDGLYGELNDKQKEYVNDILQGGLRLNGILNEIVELTRVESNKDEVNPGRFLLKDSLISSIAAFDDKAIKHNLKLTLEIEPDAEIEIETDAGKLTRILHNLIDNAVKFTPDGGSVFVKARKLNSFELRVPSSESEKNSELTTQHSETDRNFVEVSVEDTGIGIKPENIDKLFQPFLQLESPYTKKYGGIGIGLIMAKKLVELLGGNIWVESEFGKGSKFTFVIPVLRGEL